jgi:Phage integrase family
LKALRVTVASVGSLSVMLADLRHTCASLLIREGASVKAIQAQLGHATASVTLDRYGHLLPDELEHLADRLERARADALASGVWPQGGPEVVALADAAAQRPRGGDDRDIWTILILPTSHQR